jgi:hypothetical protein
MNRIFATIGATLAATALLLGATSPPTGYEEEEELGTHVRRYVATWDGSASHDLQAVAPAAMDIAGPCSPGLYRSGVQFDASVGRFYGSAIVTCSQGAYEACRTIRLRHGGAAIQRRHPRLGRRSPTRARPRRAAPAATTPSA